jgi:putative ABC transport system substrate-binding protein
VKFASNKVFAEAAPKRVHTLKLEELKQKNTSAGPVPKIVLPKVVIAITEIVKHPSLIQAKLGLIDELKNNGFIVGENLKIIEQDAQGNVSIATQIAKRFVSLKPDAIVAISTPSAQTVVNAAKDSKIPIIISSVTDPVAAGIVKDITVAQENITGAIDAPAIKEEIELIKAIMPNIKNLGLLYNSGEANSVKTIEMITKEAAASGITIVKSVATSSNQVPQSMLNLIGKVDAIYIPSDNTIFSSMAKLVQISRDNHLPVFSSDPDSVKQGVLACVGYTQYAVGRAAGRLLVQVLHGQKLLKIVKPEKIEIFINTITAGKIGIKVQSVLIGKEVNLIK